MTTRREFMGYLPAAGAAFAVVGNMVLGESPARAQDAAAPLDGHFHSEGKAPSKFTLDVLQQAKGTLPFADQRDFEELKRGFIAPMPDLKIMADAGHVAWDMERFQFLNEDRDFDSIHPSLLRQSRLNNNYGLYEVIPGIYQVRGIDLSDLTFVRGKTGWIVFDPLVSAEPVRAAWKLFQEHVGEGLPVTAVIYSHTHGDHWGGVRGLDRRGRRAFRQGCTHRTDRLHGLHHLRERLCRKRHEPAALLPVRTAPSGKSRMAMSARASAKACRPARSGSLPPTAMSRSRSRSSRSTACG